MTKGLPTNEQMLTIKAATDDMMEALLDGNDQKLALANWWLLPDSWFAFPLEVREKLAKTHMEILRASKAAENSPAREWDAEVARLESALAPLKADDKK